MQERMDMPGSYGGNGGNGERGAAGGNLLGNIDIMRLLKLMLRKLWAALLVGAIIGSCLFLYTKATYVRIYSTQTTLAFTTKSYITTTDDEGNIISIKEEIKHYTRNDASRYQFLLKTDAMCEKITAALGGEYSVNTIRNAVSVSTTDEAGIFVIEVTSSNKDLCANAIVVIINEFPEYLQRFDSSLGIEVLIRPASPTITNADEALNKGLIGFAAGMILVLGVVVLIDLLSKTVKNADDVRN